jgi:hypothetical protein
VLNIPFGLFMSVLLWAGGADRAANSSGTSRGFEEGPILEAGQDEEQTCMDDD